MNTEATLKKMTLREKAELVSGYALWFIKGVDRLNVPSIMMSDGPSGLRKQDDPTKVEESVKAVNFPASALTACSFDEDKLYKLGENLGSAARKEDVNILLGPGVNIKRTPLNGRNFEYFSEDPLLAGKLGSAYVKGVQSQGVGVSLKHFAGNNRELTRFTSTSNIDDRALREVYLKPFEYVVKNANPTTIMCSYNALNGVLNSQNKTLLTDILREEWGYKGVVMSDWGATDDHIEALKAGLNLEMPGKGELSVTEVVDAVRNDRLEESILDNSVYRILELIDKCKFAEKNNHEVKSLTEQHEFACDLAANSMVLLKNDHDVLPIRSNDNILVVGELAINPHYQGGGSSHVNLYSLITPLDGIKDHHGMVGFSKGYEENGKNNQQLIKDAVNEAKKYSKVVIFAGTTNSSESEGFDRENISLPDYQNDLICKLAEANENIVVVLQNGSVVEMPWISKVAGVLETYLAGEAVGEATWSVLSGAVNPSGKLSETFPISLKDTSAYGTFGTSKVEENYHESIFVGYKYFDIKDKEVLFPFGYGLSYTKFAYSDISLTNLDGELQVKFILKNVGTCAGSEVPQVYISNLTSDFEMPKKVLAGFTKVYLNSGESKEVVINIKKAEFTYFNPIKQSWCFDNGDYLIQLGESSRKMHFCEKIKLEWNTDPVALISRDSYLDDVIENEKLFSLFKQSKLYAGLYQPVKDNNDATLKMMRYTPLRSVLMLGSYKTSSVVDEFVNDANALSK
ncbi:MAG: glycoside hydrolase family 3 C-terminal domain-containing protein [Liquorilactobacillus ghanensis]|jgi:beta-glucosidase|uniref:beta-glucosidase n=1 Tax=Liquorilactobacillus ghanensis TaxID=399370 RepID=UPI0039ECEC42